jgi:hypothetical protein
MYGSLLFRKKGNTKIYQTKGFPENKISKYTFTNHITHKGGITPPLQMKENLLIGVP